MKKKSVKKKKVVKKKTTKKNTSKRKTVKKKVGYSKLKFKLVLNRFFVFLVLFILAFLIYSFSDNIVKDIFSLLALVFGLVTTALLLVVLIFIFLKLMKR